ncbi:uncharacterized protein LOC108208729 [Daucus carota subsp. sativus]|uniref:uncharacterized protein LOC108208729 n=1 Tax=Daucus carota subsp. sativus TaxID=79200 RepID=UPI0007B205B5|nr:PREDICTED: uncharacterized protein LOC108208729 [Daucus carota subsp. sativus]
MMPYSTTAGGYNSRRAIAYLYVASNSVASIEYLRKYWIEEPAAEVDGRGNTLIHLLVINKNLEALKALTGFVSLRQLKKQNARGETALHEAARLGLVDIAAILLDWEMRLASNSMQYYGALVTRDVNMEAVEEELEDLVAMQNKMGEIPLYVAAASGQTEVFQLLEDYNSDCHTQREDGCTVLHAAILRENYNMAISISRRYPQLAHKPDIRGNTPLNLLATSPSHFKSGSFFARGNLGRRPFIPLLSLAIVIYRCIPPTHSFGSVGDRQKIKRNIFVEMILSFSCLKHVDETKQQNLLAEELARILIEQEADWSFYSYNECTSQVLSAPENTLKVPVKNRNGVCDPLIQAIERSIPELVMKIVEHCPDSVNCVDEKGRNILHLAAEYKNLDIYNQLKKHVGEDNKERMMTEVDYEGNTIVHQASIINPISPYISLGIFYATCWDVFWFVRVSADCLPYMRFIPNKEGKTATELFITRSKRQREDAWKAMKDINGTLMVVAALIGTISFAAIFTVPGGYDQKHGYPLLLKPYKRDVDLFLGYDAFTLFASTFALGNLLSIQLSRFKVEEFCIALPLKYFTAISAMYYAACFTVVTTLQAFILEECLPRLYVIFVFFIIIVLSWGYIDSAYNVVSYIWVAKTSRTVTALAYQTF